MNLEKNIINSKLPATPETFYKKEWKGWDDFLGRINIWTDKKVLNFLLSIENELELLEPIEILAIIEQSGSQNILKKNQHFKSILRTHSNTLERMEAIAELKKTLTTSDDNTITNLINSNLHNQINNESLNQLNSENNIIKETISETFNYTKILKAYDNKKISTNLDHETISFLIKYRIDKLWSDFMSNNYDINILKNETGGKYFTIIKERFLIEYELVTNIELPLDYEFKDDNGNILQPNLMQKLVVQRLMDNKRYGNWSSMGAGKTLSGVLAGRIIGNKNTLIITFNANVEDWENTINNAFPKNSKIYTKENSIPKLEDKVFNYLIFNYETFSTQSANELIKVIASNNIDYVILDEVQLIKQRYEEMSSNRKKIITKLVSLIDIQSNKNYKELYILAMSATPVINNLLEPKKILEILKGVQYNDIKTFPNVNNALNIHKHFFINGIRFKPKYDIDIKTILLKIDGKHLIYQYLNVPKRRVLSIEQILIPDKLNSIKEYLKSGTMIYTHYVTGIIDKIKTFVEENGFKTAIYTGENKDGLRCFRNNECDILICSSPIGTGVDGLQKICDRLIILNLPWTNSEYENLIGRIARQGSKFDSIEVIIPQIEISELKNLEDESYSWDIDRMERIVNKKTLSNVALDGIIPENLLPTPSEMLKQSQEKFKKWIKRIEKNGLITLNRESILVQVEEGILEIKQTPIEENIIEDIEIISDIYEEKMDYENDITEDNIIEPKNRKEEKEAIIKEQLIDKELKAIDRALFKDSDNDYKFTKSILTSEQKRLIEEQKKKCKIPVKINDTLTVYVDDISKIKEVREKYLNQYAIKYEISNSDRKKLPKYVMLDIHKLTLVGKRYYKDDWYVTYEVKDGKLYSISDSHYLNEIELIPISKEEFTTE